MSLNRWMIKQIVHTMKYYTAIKNECTINTNNNSSLDGFQENYAEWKMPIPKVTHILYDSIYIPLYQY